MTEPGAPKLKRTLPTRRKLIEHMKELTGYVHHLLEEGKLYDQEGGYTFPDGCRFVRPGSAPPPTEMEN